MGKVDDKIRTSTVLLELEPIAKYSTGSTCITAWLGWSDSGNFFYRSNPNNMYIKLKLMICRKSYVSRCSIMTIFDGVIFITFFFNLTVFVVLVIHKTHGKKTGMRKKSQFLRYLKCVLPPQL